MGRGKKRAHASVLLLALTVCVLALSFALPVMVAGVQDRFITARAGDREMREVSLSVANSEMSMIELLQFRSQEYTTLPLGDPVREEDALEKYNIALDALRFLESQGITSLYPEQYTVHREIRFLIADKSLEDSRLIWQIFLMSETQETTITIFLDDATGKVIVFDISGKNVLEDAPQVWAEALSRYYGFSHVELTKSERLRFVDASGFTIECSFWLSEYELSFNRDAMLIYQNEYEVTTPHLT